MFSIYWTHHNVREFYQVLDLKYSAPRGGGRDADRVTATILTVDGPQEREFTEGRIIFRTGDYCLDEICLKDTRLGSDGA